MKIKRLAKDDKGEWLPRLLSLRAAELAGGETVHQGRWLTERGLASFGLMVFEQAEGTRPLE